MNLTRRYFLMGLLFLSMPAWGVNCLPDTIILTTQAEVDDFQSNHGPGCDTVVTGLIIDGASIVDLAPLAELTSVSTPGGFDINRKLLVNGTSLSSLAGLENLRNVFWFEINNNPDLTSLAALSDLAIIQGPLFINGNSILTNLDGLESLTALGSGALIIENNPLLADLSGAANIATINGSLSVDNNDSLLNLDDLSGLNQVNFSIAISNNDLLTHIGALGGLIDFNAELTVRLNSQLSSLGDLSNFSELGGLVIWGNPQLTNLDGLSNLTSLGINTSLALLFNDTLSDISSLANVVAAGLNVEITDNPMLDDCSPLKTLLDLVDDAEPGPGPGVAGIPDVGGDVHLANNLPGCNSLEVFEPGEGTFVYGGFGNGRPHLLFKGLNITLNCFDAPLQIPNGGSVLVNQVQFSCSSIPFLDTDTLIYDVPTDSCTTYSDFSSATDLQIDGVYFETGNTGATLQQQANLIFETDENALLLFDPQSGELRVGQSMVCAYPGPAERIFNSGFE